MKNWTCLQMKFDRHSLANVKSSQRFWVKKYNWFPWLSWRSETILNHSIILWLNPNPSGLRSKQWHTPDGRFSDSYSSVSRSDRHSWISIRQATLPCKIYYLLLHLSQSSFRKWYNIVYDCLVKSASLVVLVRSKTLGHDSLCMKFKCSDLSEGVTKLFYK